MPSIPNKQPAGHVFSAHMDLRKGDSPRSAVGATLTEVWESVEMWRNWSMMIWVVVSNIFYFHPYLGKWSNLTNIFLMGWNHQLVYYGWWFIMDDDDNEWWMMNDEWWMMNDEWWMMNDGDVTASVLMMILMIMMNGGCLVTIVDVCHQAGWYVLGQI